jgi:hypothetical protein
LLVDREGDVHLHSICAHIICVKRTRPVQTYHIIGTTTCDGWSESS